jgi:hypothetical protein
MKLDQAAIPYLMGEKFSNKLLVPYDFHDVIPNRVSFVCSLAKGKKIIHLGCLDHLPLIDSKIASGQWLHKELTACAAKCVGIDIDTEVAEYVRSSHGFDNIILGDFTTVRIPEIMSEKWDFAVLGELLEHIDNPVDYLCAIQKNYAGVIDRIIITVPNAWTQTTMKMANRSSEVINSDHRYWFTPYTLAKVIVRAGMEVDEVYFANRVPLSFLGLVKNKIFKILGLKMKFNYTYASSLVAVARLIPGA